MADSENSDFTEQEKKLVCEILTRAWLSMDLNRETGRYETNGALEGSLAVMSKEQMNTLVNAINKTRGPAVAESEKKDRN